MHLSLAGEQCARAGLSGVIGKSTRWSVHGQLWFSLTEGDTPVGVDALAHDWTKNSVVHLPSKGSHSSGFGESGEGQAQANSNCPPLGNLASGPKEVEAA